MLPWILHGRWHQRRDGDYEIISPRRSGDGGGNFARLAPNDVDGACDNESGGEATRTPQLAQALMGVDAVGTGQREQFSDLATAEAGLSLALLAVVMVGLRQSM